MKLFSICFQNTSIRNNSNDLQQISHRDSLLFSVIGQLANKRSVCYQIQCTKLVKMECKMMSIMRTSFNVLSENCSANEMFCWRINHIIDIQFCALSFVSLQHGQWLKTHKCLSVVVSHLSICQHWHWCIDIDNDTGASVWQPCSNKLTEFQRRGTSWLFAKMFHGGQCPSAFSTLVWIESHAAAESFCDRKNMHFMKKLCQLVCLFLRLFQSPPGRLNVTRFEMSNVHHLSCELFPDNKMLGFIWICSRTLSTQCPHGETECYFISS